MPKFDQATTGSSVNAQAPGPTSGRQGAGPTSLDTRSATDVAFGELQTAVEPEFAEDGRLIDYLSGDLLVDKPEERVRQQYLRILDRQYGYPKSVMAREVPVQYGSSQARDQAGHPVFADIVVYETPQARQQRDQAAIRFVVELKAPTEETGYNQLVSYVFNTAADGAVWFNGRLAARWYRRSSTPTQRLVPWPGLPRYSEAWDAVGKREKSQLRPLVDVRGTLARCHNKLHRRGAEGEDLTMDMVRILLAKARDEDREGTTPLFYCTPEEYESEQGQQSVADRVQLLFEEVRAANPTVFDATEIIRVGTRQIVEVVSELQDYRLIGDDDEQWDVMGAAYEQYTAEVLKREGGQFFTNRLVVKLLTRMVNPGPDDTVLDPAGGTGGFCTATIRHMRETIREQQTTAAMQRRRMEQIKDRIFFIDISHRLVKIAKAAMILTGNGHRGFTQGDSLMPPDRLLESFRERCQPGRIDRVLTNPPFAGTTNGKIDSPAEMVPQFELARRWQWSGSRHVPTAEPASGGTPPELLFIERCVQWLRPGGLLGIVVLKGVLENPDVTLAARHFIFKNTFVRAVVACHKDTFQPYTGSRTALLVLQKKTAAEVGAADPDYPIFMSISRKIGQNSEGEPILARDEQGRLSDRLDHDLDEIYAGWRAHLEGDFTPSEFMFEVRRSQVDARSMLISPQAFLPSLNEAIAAVLRLGERSDMTTVRLGDDEIGAHIYKGSRFKREDLETDIQEGPQVVKYLTPSALLQDRAESVKFWDLAKVTEARRRELGRHRLRRLEVLVTRSGTIGRVVLTTADHEGHFGSDDLIHIDIENEDLRLYVYEFLLSDLGQKQMKKNEYGTIQQHLEPAHMRDVLIPLPVDPSPVREIAERMRRSVKAKEQSTAEEREGSRLLAALTAEQSQDDPDGSGSG